MKIIVNHFLDPRITITPNAGSTDKSWVWVAFDFSDGANLVETVSLNHRNYNDSTYLQRIDFRHKI